jgi:hypothetical protein
MSQPTPKQEGKQVTPELLECLLDMELEDKEVVISLVQDRFEFGLKKYGQPLCTKDGRDDVIDAMQEMGDLLQYTYKAKMNGRLPDLKKQLLPCLDALVQIVQVDKTELL